jgi:hypothetical protein
MAVRACSELSRTLGEPLVATAPEASAWLLVEQAGPWGAKALVESRLDRAIGEQLEQRGKELGVKVLLIKPPGRSAAGRRRFACFAGQNRAFLEELEPGDPASLLELDLDALARGQRTPSSRPVEQLYLVCTNSRRDACCARFGRPLAATLAERFDGRVWECSHLGGHRFAPNLVALPEGLVFGRASLSAAAEVAQGRIELESFRGRSSFAPAVQAADCFVRQREGLRGIDDLVLEASDGDATVFRSGAGRFRVLVSSEDREPARSFSCGETKLERPVAWSLAGIERL